jgi:diaminopimelate decarboxylase/aspartate kinase
MHSEPTFELDAESPSPATTDSPWVIMKFGGSSVATAENWRSIAGRIRNRRDAGLHVVVVHSALRGVSDQLLALLGACADGGGDELLSAIIERHRELGMQFGIDADALLADYVDELQRLAAGVRLVREVSPRVHARVMAFGELMATTLSATWLRQQGIAVEWRDARELLRSRSDPQASERRAMTNAVCEYEPDPALRERLLADGVTLTQGFIASSDRGETVLLGRGGSDTSAAYFAARLQARRLEIWSDVPGMFSADPRVVPAARLLTRLHYAEAQEIASTGGLVLHPRCIAPVRQYGIPLFVRCTPRPDLPGTVIGNLAGEPEPRVKAISLRQNLTLLSMEGIVMWHEVGFLARAFAVFADHGVSVDLVSTSEANVTVSIDDDGASLDEASLEALVDELSAMCRVRVLRDCAAVTLVGRKIRTILHKIGPALEVFEEQRIHLVSQAANDLNLSFVVDEDQGYRLVQELHPALIRPTPGDDSIGATWEELHRDERPAPEAPAAWWRLRRDDLLSALERRESAYVYDPGTIDAAIDALQSLSAVDGVFYAMKANPNVDVLRQIHSRGVNFECVSPGEIQRVLGLFPDIDRKRILFTPNFAPREEYAFGFDAGVWLTLDNLYPLKAWPELFAGRDVFVRLDPGQGRGHHEHVKTAGTHSKFGVPLFELDELRRLVDDAGCRVVGIHAHSGSGILDAHNWRQVAETLAAAAEAFPDVHTLDLGGGLGVPEKPGDTSLDFAALDASLASLREAWPQYRIWLEPGRFIVAQAGVLLARVTQTKGKGEMRYVGVSTGMNSLIRPALYGAYHEIVNLTRLDDPPSELVTVVGPICESGDRLGSDRLLPPSSEGDVILIANAGAYAHAMSSHYNLREPAGEILLPQAAAGG